MSSIRAWYGIMAGEASFRISPETQSGHTDLFSRTLQPFPNDFNINGEMFA
jgi:hypothetical protein